MKTNSDKLHIALVSQFLETNISNVMAPLALRGLRTRTAVCRRLEMKRGGWAGRSTSPMAR